MFNIIIVKDVFDLNYIIIYWKILRVLYEKNVNIKSYYCYFLYIYLMKLKKNSNVIIEIKC